MIGRKLVHHALPPPAQLGQMDGAGGRVAGGAHVQRHRGDGQGAVVADGNLHADHLAAVDLRAAEGVFHLTLFSAMRTLARENTHASAMIAAMSRYMRLPIDSAHSRKKPKHVARVALAFFTGRDSFRVEWAAPGRSAQAQGTGTFSTTAMRMRSALMPFILASGLGVMRWASTGSTMRCTSSGRI